MYAVSPVIETVDLVQVAFDSLRDRICVVDGSGNILLTNETWDQAARDLGARPSDCGTGMNYLRICWSAAGKYSERALEAANGIEAVLRGTLPVFTLDYPFPSSSREAWYRLAARPLHRPHSGAVITHSEITNQVIIADKLRQTRTQYGALLDKSADALTLLTGHGVIQYVSPASEEVLGVSAQGLRGHAIRDFIHPADCGAFSKLLSDCRRHTGRKYTCQYRFRDSNGAWRTLEGIARKIDDDAEREIILNSRDISHRMRRGEEQGLPAGRRDALEILTAWLLREREEDARHVAAQMHSSLNQRLASMSLQAAHLPESAASQGRALREAIAGLGYELQQIAGGLYPAMLDHFGLGAALRDLCSEFTRQHGVPVNYVHRGVPARLPAHQAAMLYRVAEEALTNTGKHARATQAWVTLSRTGQGIRLVIRDDGAGFDPAAVEAGATRGLAIMGERLRAIEGTLTIRSRSTAGTEVVALAPLFSAGNEPRAAIAGDVVVNPLDQHQ